MKVEQNFWKDSKNVNDNKNNNQLGGGKQM